jgi:carbon-monoxide dehydrogenase large subunit
MEEVDIEYEPLKPIADPVQALRAEPLHPGTKSNIVASTQRGKDFTLKNAAVEVEEEFVNERVITNPLEPRGVVASFDGSRLTVYGSSQSVHSWKEGICDCMGLAPDKVRVVQMDTGGAFGSKSGIYPEYIVASYLSMKTKRPVKWIETRSEHLLATHQGRGSRAKMHIYADENGLVQGLKADLLVDAGAYPVGMGAFAPGWIGLQLTGPYNFPHAFVDAKSVYTNKVPLGPYRGAGRPEAAFFIERIMDLLADELHMDPVELRLKNVSDKPITSPLGIRNEPFKPFLESAVRELDYQNRSRNGAVGFSCFVLIPAIQPGESARVAISGGKVKVWLGACTHGQGHDILAKLLVSEELGVPESAIEFEMGDTDQLSEGVGSWGSRTAIVGSGALIQACRKIKEEAKRKFGDDKPETLLANDLNAYVFYSRREPLNSFGANLVSASRNEFGELRIDECLAYYDAGRVLNPAMVESQVIGGSAQAIGQVLYEEAKYDEEGQLLAVTISETGLPRAQHMPKFTLKLAAHSIPTEQPRGIGESPTMGVPPAAIRAIEKLAGRRITKTPARPEDISQRPVMS